MTLGALCAEIRDLPVDQIDVAAVLRVLEPLWERIPETASRLRAQIELVLGFATVRGWRHGDNPARWRGHLQTVLPRRKVIDRRHHPAMEFADVPAFVAELRRQGSIPAMALEFLILTGARAGEALGATWREINLDKRLWIFPAHRMKGGRPHEVPLSRRAVEILERAAAINQSGEFVFPGRSGIKPMSGHALAGPLAGLDATIHGFRSSLRSWCAQAGVPRDVAESLLAHKILNAVEAAYQRHSFLQKRREVLERWSAQGNRISK